MSAVTLSKKLTEAEYLALENASEYKSEFYRGEVFAMSGASPQHNRIKENLAGEIYARFKGGKCQSFSSDQRVKVEESGFICYPDVLIVCEEPKYSNTDKYSLTNPQILIEVLSPSTERRDRLLKFCEYQKIPTLKEYILVAQSYKEIERLTRGAADHWDYAVFDGKQTELSISSIPLTLQIADIFAGLDIPETRKEFEATQEVI